MRKVIVIVISLGMGVAGAGAVIASEELAKKHGCLTCHDMNAKKMGPSFKDISKKHKGKADAEAALVKELGEGKKHPKVAASEADRKTLVKWVLSQ